MGTGPLSGMMMQQQMAGAGMHSSNEHSRAHSVMDEIVNPTDSTKLEMRMDGSLATADGQDADVSDAMAVMSGLYVGPSASDGRSVEERTQKYVNPIAETNASDIDSDMALLDMLDIPDVAMSDTAHLQEPTPKEVEAADLDDLAMLDLLDIPEVENL
eukprot:SAG31_NODE_14901_length_781_cov_1.690616_1_plen_158_part_00